MTSINFRRNSMRGISRIKGRKKIDDQENKHLVLPLLYKTYVAQSSQFFGRQGEKYYQTHRDFPGIQASWLVIVEIVVNHSVWEISHSLYRPTGARLFYLICLALCERPRPTQTPCTCRRRECRDISEFVGRRNKAFPTNSRRETTLGNN